MPSRIQSPSSINSYKQCPRKYFYQYIQKIETKDNIHTLRGGIVHKVMEEFFKIADVPAEGYDIRFQIEMLTLLKKHWDANILALTQLAADYELEFYHHQSQMMVVNMANIVTKKFEKQLRLGLPPIEAFIKITPTAEQEFVSEFYKVRGFIDAIESNEEGIRIMDYKTSKKSEISEAYRLQLAIYALLYEEKHGHRPAKVGIYFLNESEKLLDVNEELLRLAKMEIDMIHAATEPDHLEAYPMKISRLCNYGSGKCDFYEKCFSSDDRFNELLKISWKRN